MSTENIGTLATPEDALIGSLERYLYGGQSIQTTTLVGILQLLKEQREANTELNRQVSALQTSQDNIINGLGIKGDGPESKLAIEYVLGLVAENVALKKAIPSPIEVELDNDSMDDVSIAESIGFNDAISAFWKKCPATPNTDASLAEIKAQGVDEFVSELAGKIRLAGGEDGYSLVNYGEYADHLESKGEEFAANLRAGRKG